MKYLLLFLSALLILKNTFSQTNADMDLITLTNGYQYLGYIIEMQPEKAIKMYRPIKKDTVTINLEDIEIRSVVSGNITFENNKELTIKNKIKNGILKNDTTRLNKFNNKLNISQFSFCGASNFWEYDFLKGFGYAYYRNFNNKYYVGASTSVMGNMSGLNWPSNGPSKGSYFSKDSLLVEYTRYNKKLIIAMMFENKINILYWLPQKRRISLLLGVNLGYVFDFSETEGYAENAKTDKYLYDYTENYKGNFIFQTTLSFKLNPEHNSGIIIEPGLAFYNPGVTITQNTSQTASNGYTTYNNSYAGHKYIDLPFFVTGRISYFF